MDMREINADDRNRKLCQAIRDASDGSGRGQISGGGCIVLFVLMVVVAFVDHGRKTWWKVAPATVAKVEVPPAAEEPPAEAKEPPPAVEVPPFPPVEIAVDPPPVEPVKPLEPG